MLRILLAGFIAFLSLSSGTYARPSSYAVWAADSAIARGQGNGLSSGQPIVSYEHGEFQWGLRLLYEMTGNKTYLNYIKTGVDNIVFDNGTVHGSYTTGPTFLYLYDLTKQAKYKTAADIFRTQLNSHPRTAQGQFWHKLKYPNQGWLDGIYMESNATAWSDITSQFRLMYENTAQNATAPKQYRPLIPRGHSPEVWDRALGWYSMALVDVLDILPESSEGQTLVLNLLRTLVPHIRDAADKDSGAWQKTISRAVGTSMFVYSLLKAVRKGWISDADGSIVKAAKKAYNYAVNNWVVANADGTMGWLNTVVVGSLDTTGDFDYYVSQPTDLNDLKGLAAFLLASLEYEQL
ncbi:glycoside hydrolase family 105 protein [Cyathus striatus]|nr:glycoside hydrolase family 105 protein [Cyathus striatus]